MTNTLWPALVAFVLAFVLACDLPRDTSEKSISTDSIRSDPSNWAVRGFRLGASREQILTAARQRFPSKLHGPRDKSIPVDEHTQFVRYVAGSNDCGTAVRFACERFDFYFADDSVGGGLDYVQLIQSFGTERVSVADLLDSLRGAFGRESRLIVHPRENVGGVLGLPGETLAIWAQRSIPDGVSIDLDILPADLAKHLGGGRIAIAKIGHIGGDDMYAQGIVVELRDLDAQQETVKALLGEERKSDTNF